MSKIHTFVAIYTGDTVANARLIAASAAPELVRYVAEALYNNTPRETGNEATQHIEQGRHNALRLIVEQEGGE